MRVGATSFIYPGGWLHNVERLAPHFDDIEILFFESQGADAFPSPEECRGLRRCKRDHGLTYSLHTPLDVSLASLDPGRRRAAVEGLRRAMGAAETFAPEAFVLHVYFGDSEQAERPSDVTAWRAHAGESLGEILRTGVAAERLCVESLDYDLALLEPLIDALDLSIALDVGHLVRDGQDELQALGRFLPRARIIQWHGTQPGARDHRSLAHYPSARGRALLTELAARDYAGVLTLEVFSEADLRESCAVARALLRDLDLGDRRPAWLERPPF